MPKRTDIKSILIIGAGPIGIETALYATELNLDVLVFEKSEIAANLRKLPQSG